MVEVERVALDVVTSRQVLKGYDPAMDFAENRPDDDVRRFPRLPDSRKRQRVLRPAMKASRSARLTRIA
jgi:hypothetical protein